jgi:Ca2+-binding RTX toxin-like protein
MSTTELSTVSQADRDRPSRPYFFLEPKSGQGAAAVGTILALTAAVFAQRVLFGSSQSNANQIDADDEHTGSLSPRDPTTAMYPDNDQDQDQGRSGRRLPEQPNHARSGVGEATSDQEFQEHPYPKGSGATPQHASSQSDADRAAGNDNSPRAQLRDRAAPDQGAHGGGGGGGGGGDSGSGSKASGRSGSKSSGPPGTENPPGSSTSNPSTGSGGNSGGATGGSNPGSSGDSTPPSNARTNRAPAVSGPVVLNDGMMNIAVAISLAMLLEHASDPDGDTLSVVGLVADSGDLHDNGDGSWRFTPVSGDDTQAGFHYFVSDGQDRTAQTALLDLLPAPPSPPLSDPFAGTPNPDVINGSPQDDVIDAKAGDDIVFGAAGNDIIYGGDGNDVLHGDAGDDIIFAGAGNDIVFGGDGADIVFAGTGDDLVFADAGNDIVHGGTGNDVVHGGAGDDLLNGGGDADRLIGDEGHDIIHGDDGSDIVVASIGDGDDEIDGGAGNDIYDLSAATRSVAVDLEAGSSSGNDTGVDSIMAIENLVGGSADDMLAGDANANALSGGDGDDRLIGRGGGDDLSGGNGEDTIVATLDDGDDRIDGGAGDDSYDLSAAKKSVVVDLRAGMATGADIGTDSLSDIENVVGGTGDDVFVSDQHRNAFTGGGGADTFVLGRASNDDNPLHWDQIRDFSQGDRIDVRLDPLDPSEPESPSLQFDGPYDGDEQAMTDRGGKLQFKYTNFDDGEHTLVVGWSKDGASELVQVDLVGHHCLTQNDFIGTH